MTNNAFTSGDINSTGSSCLDGTDLTRAPKWDKKGNKVGTRTPKPDKTGNKVGTRTPKWDKKGNKVETRLDKKDKNEERRQE